MLSFSWPKESEQDDGQDNGKYYNGLYRVWGLGCLGYGKENANHCIIIGVF